MHDVLVGKFMLDPVTASLSVRIQGRLEAASVMVSVQSSLGF